MAIRIANYAFLRWALIPAIAAHNLEEWLTFPAFRQGAGRTLESLNLSVQSDPWDVTQLALVLATAISALAVVYAGLGRQTRAKEFIVCTIAGIYFANVFLPHIPSAIAAKGYAPGVVTAVLVNLPLCFSLWRGAVGERILSLPQVIWSGILGAILLIPSIVAVMLMADLVLRLLWG